MSQDHDSDISKSDAEKELEQIQRQPSWENRITTAIRDTKEPDLEVGAVAPPNSEDALKPERRGSSDTSTSTRSSVSNDTPLTASDAHDHQIPPHRSRSRPTVRSRAQSSRSTGGGGGGGGGGSIRRDAIKVPKSERRGLLARFCFFDEVTNSQDLSRKKKWTITAIVALAGAAAPMGSSIVLPALVDIIAEFHSTATVGNLSVAMYMLAMSIFPLWWSSFSETLGRRTIYVVSFFLFLIFNILAAVSTSMAMFIVMRLLSGGAAASVQAVGAGTIADLWQAKERGQAMGMFYLGPLCGPLVSPILGGVFAQTLGWRSAQWFLAIFAGVLWIFIVVALPETLRQQRALVAEVEADLEVVDEKTDARPGLARTTTTQSVKIKSKKWLMIAKRAFIDPLRIILYLQFPAVALLVMYASVTFGSLYVLNISVQAEFSAAPYNYNSIIVGCLYIPNAAGYFLSSVFGGRWVDRIMHREAKKAGRYDERGRLIFIPEDRMKENAWIGAALYPLALLAYGWFTKYNINVAAALVANFFFGVGSMLIFALVTTMLTEFMPRKASSGIALNNFVRNIFSCVGSVVTEPLIVAIGTGWLFTGLCVIALGFGFVTMWSMKIFGPRWRIAMDQRLDKVMGD